MPVLEVTKLRLKGVSAADPWLLESLSKVRTALQTNSQFYHCIEDPSLLFILGLWPSLEAHHAFLNNSPERKKVLGPQEEYLEFQWSVHMELDAMISLPLDAPVMAIARLLIKDEKTCINKYDTVVANYKQNLVEATAPHPLAYGWRHDAPAGEPEALMFTGWASVDAHKEFTAKTRESAEYASVRDTYRGMEVQHARNLEKQDASS